ncbi:MAG: hypothetical protein ACRD1Z_21890 [Vicinamibacteria bacterium]
MRRRSVLCMASAALLGSGEAGAEPTAEEMLRERGLSEEQAQRLLEELPEAGLDEEWVRKALSGEEKPRRLTAQDYLAGGDGETNRLMLRGAAANDLDLARAVLFRQELRSSTWPEDEVLLGLHIGRGSGNLDHARVLDLLEDAFPLYPPLDGRREAIGQAWAAAFWYLHKDAAYELARQAVANTALTPQQRALHLLVFQHAGYEEVVYRRKEFRPMALETYRPYLRASEPDLQRAALIVARMLWDYAVLEDLKHVALSSTDPKARIDAWAQVVNLLEQGPKPEPRGIRPLGGFDPSPVGGAYDPEGLRIWLEEVKPEWQREQHRLLTGGEPPPAPVRSERTRTPSDRGVGSEGSRSFGREPNTPPEGP